MNSEDFLSGRPNSESVEESFSNSFQLNELAGVTIKYYTGEVACVNSERVENYYKRPDLRQEVKAKVSLEPLVRARVNCS